MVQIVYSTKYRRAMEIFRALLKRNEHSERALLLTTEILKSNPSHYPVWTYRLQILKGLNSSNPDGNHLRKELKFLSKVMPQIRKSFQAWTHRFSIVLLINDPSDELEFVNSALECDYKNYHSWTYRQNLLYTFKRPEMWEGELDFITDLIEKDLRNNSAWNHRFFISFESFKIREHDKEFLSSSDVLDSVVQREIQYTKDQIFKSPNNPSAWNYLRGVLKRGSVSFNDLRDFVIPLTKRREELELMGWPEELNLQSQLPAVGAVEFLADIYLLDQKQSQSANDLFKLLAEELDPIRKNYWSYRSKTSFSLSS
ncbi:protein prenylyltransferase [Phakopsora pachyrhizi]|nr:protein prenylyltransferase [Phakopsora pachyrhizi]